MKTVKHLFLSFALVAVLSSLLPAQETKVSIKEILSDPGRFVENLVKVEGRVVKKDQGLAETTKFYFLSDDFGEEIRVNTPREYPEVGKRYEVTGIVYTSQSGDRQAFISEQSRTGGGPPLWLIITLGVLLLLLIFLVVYYFAVQTRPPKSEPTPTNKTSKMSNSKLQTLRIDLAPSTVRLMPGKLRILSDGMDKGKSFTMAGFPTANGNVVTVGRDKAEPQKSYAHIELSGYRTVSRKQAELIERDGAIRLRNLGAVNPTMVNGQPIPVNNIVPIRPGDRITMGELELVYERR